jgi:hypothetical protein
VTPGAVLSVQQREVAHFLGFEFDIGLGGLAWWPATRTQQERHQTYG